MSLIYSKSKTGKTTVWSAILNPTPNSSGYLEITIESGYEDGKKVKKIKEVKAGKNIGRANETTLLEQASLELERLYQSKYDKGYKDNKSEATVEKTSNNILKPMLADKYPEKVHKLPQDPSEVGLQPKVDGLRCFVEKMSDSSVRFTSRSGKSFTPIVHIAEQASEKLSVGDIMDGELYIPGKDLQEIMSVVSPSKNIKEEALKEVKLFWYDFIPVGQEDKAFKERFLDSNLEFDTNSIVKLPTFIYAPEPEDSIKIDSEMFIDLMEKQFDNYIENGYEGLMLRDLNSPYYFGRRSSTLLKYKKMFTDEFKIVDILESDNDEAPRFVCDLRNENFVTVRLKGSKEDNLEYLNNKENYINKWLTIKYQTWTKTGSLQFPVGIAIRDGEVVNDIFVPSI